MKKSEVHREPSIPVHIGAKSLINGREERIRTSGPCLPKTLPRSAYGGFPWFPPCVASCLNAYVPV